MKQTTGDRFFSYFCYGIVALVTAFCFLPFWMMALSSITPEREILLHGYKLYTTSFTFESYRVLLTSSSVIRNGYAVTSFITLMGTFLGVLCCSTFAYSISNKKNRYRNWLSFYIYFTMLFSGGLVPTYILISKWLHLADSLWAVILPGLMNPFLVFIMVAFFRKIPEELVESGRIDGANEAKIFFRLIVPISTPVLATVALFFALGYWNEWFRSLLYLSDDRLYPLQIILRLITSNVEASRNLAPEASFNVSVPSYQLRMAATLITIGPIIFIYPFVQRYFVKGLTIGAIKG